MSANDQNDYLESNDQLTSNQTTALNNQSADTDDQDGALGDEGDWTSSAAPDSLDTDDSDEENDDGQSQGGSMGGGQSTKQI